MNVRNFSKIEAYLQQQPTTLTTLTTATPKLRPGAVYCVPCTGTQRVNCKLHGTYFQITFHILVLTSISSGAILSFEFDTHLHGFFILNPFRTLQKNIIGYKVPWLSNGPWRVSSSYATQ